MRHKLSCFMQGDQSRRTGTLGFSPDVTSPGLQALVRLYCSTPQRLGYICPAVPTSLQLQDGRVVVPKTCIAPESHCSSVSLRAADVLRGSVDEMHVVIKTSTHITEEVGLCPQKKSRMQHVHIHGRLAYMVELPASTGHQNHARKP
jgi:hypothetical protein